MNHFLAQTARLHAEGAPACIPTSKYSPDVQARHCEPGHAQDFEQFVILDVEQSHDNNLGGAES